MKRSPLARRTPLRASAPIKQRSVKKRRTDASLDAVTPALIARSGGMCEARTTVCAGVAVHRHHVLRRPHTAGAHVLDDLMHVCHPCHDWVHAHPAVSYEAGWLRRSGVDS